LGYSSRYHAASLAAVFLALAIGILIGAGLGGNVLNDTEDSLRKSLEEDLSDAQSQSDELRASLERQREFATRAYPALVGDRLAGERVGVIAIGDLPGAVSDDIEGALDPTGADFGSIAVVRTPPDVSGLGDDLKGTAFAKVAKDPAALEDLGRRIGRELAAGGGKLVQRTRGVLLARSSGEGQPLNRVILVRQPAGDLPPKEKAALDSLETGIVEGVRRSGRNSVAVETSDAEDSSVPFFKDRDIATVDDIDATAGRVAMVFALLGASGDYGVKDTADRLLPELLVPPASTP
jgi:hypothetical protein